ncbi:antimicrobial peptide THP1-like [Malaclemys terrapin pileata]|uniref:antimicrobial peptide THP1-like n=1 Tax=Malaclemys terrapin pileata TaxID=2991368 RepID=UPI0023A85205|nr:antimicrobial peptide THP1-like [Malaclemys terrapin pileata]
MKIFYLLFALVFLVLQGAPEFSQAWRSRKRCKRAGGICFSGPCPSRYRLTGICSRKYSCCQLQYLSKTIQNAKAGQINVASGTAPREAVGKERI